MPDEQDSAEALDDDKGAFPDDSSPGVDIFDQTADANPGVADLGRDLIDDGETGNEIDGVEAEPDNGTDPFHTEEPSPEVAAMHITEEERS
jgi:hypothetical protein